MDTIETLITTHRCPFCGKAPSCADMLVGVTAERTGREICYVCGWGFRSNISSNVSRECGHPCCCRNPREAVATGLAICRECP